MKILLTGANGLLGRCFAKEIVNQGHDVSCCGNNDLSNGVIKLDITDAAQVNDTLKNCEFTHIINCAADRDPESCLNNPIRAYTINAAGAENLAKAANNFKLTLCHISTDYVFDGKNPPYSEEASTCPVNLYGRSKLAGELAAQTAHKHLILRIPALFRTDITDQRNLAYKLNSELSYSQQIKLDNLASRFYTLADDVAHAGIALLEKNISGIVHLSAEERTTKAEFARIFARSHGYDESLIINVDTPTPTTEKRPEDSHLNSNLYKSILEYKFSGPSAAFTQK